MVNNEKEGASSAQSRISSVWKILTVILLVLSSFSIYWPAIASGLHSDDWGLSANLSNPWVSFLGHWTYGGKGSFYRPLSRLLIFYEGRLFGYSGFGQHIISQILFLGAVAFTSLSVRRFAGFSGAIVSAVFLITSPVAAPAVCWVSSQTDLLAGFFFTLTLYFISRHPRELTWRSVYYSFIAGFLCYLSKDSAAVLGPIAVVYLVMLAIFIGPKKLFSYRPAVVWGIGNVVFLFAYLMFRYWRLGQFGGNEHSKELVYSLGLIWHINQTYLTVLRDLSYPLTQLFPATHSSFVGRFSAWWPMLLTLGLISWFLSMRRFLEAILVIGFLITVSPLFTVQIQYYPENGMAGVRRYLYLPLFFLGSLIGVLARNKDRENRSSDSLSGAVIALMIPIIFLQTFVTQERVTDYYEAGQFRDSLVERLRQIKNSGQGDVDYHFERLPANIGEAYAFVNGIEYMLPIVLPGSRGITKDNPGYMKPDSSTGRRAYLIHVDDNLKITVTSLDEKNKAITQLRAASLIPTEPLEFHFDTGSKDSKGLFFNEDIEVLPSEKDLLINVINRDAVIILPPIKTEPYYRFKQAEIKFELLETGGKQKEGIFQFIWAIDSDKKEFPSLDQRVQFNPGIQTVVFDLDKSPQWYREGKLVMTRFDIPENYRGKIRIVSFGLK